MDSDAKIEVLSECCALLRFINLSSKTRLRMGRSAIPNSVLYTLLSIPLSFSVMCDVMKVLDMELNFQQNANSFLFIPGTTQMQLIYFCLAFQNDLITETVEQIQKIVDRSKCLLLI